jgi:hypothetical protein
MLDLLVGSEEVRRQTKAALELERRGSARPAARPHRQARARTVLAIAPRALRTLRQAASS